METRSLQNEVTETGLKKRDRENINIVTEYQETVLPTIKNIMNLEA